MNWIDTTVGEFCPFIYGKGLPKTKRQAGEYPVYGSNGCVDFHNDFYINGPGIIIGRKGSVGAVHLSTQPFWPIDTAFYVTKGTLGELRFTYYLLKSLGLEKMNSDSAVPGLNRDNAHALSIRIPESPESRESLGNQIALLDEKIAANSGVNQTLEQMAQAIFKSWFVDFDPVKAKMNGEQPEGMDAATASLFPEKLVESELGLIPEGWPVGKLSELIKFANGKSGKKSDSGQFPLYGANGIIGFSEEAKFEDAVIIGRVGAYCGAIEYCNSQFWASDNTIVATAKSGKAQLPFVLYLLKYLDLNQHAGGAAQPLLNQKVLNSLEVAIPSNAVLERYGALLATMLDKMTRNIEENHNLESLRDTLLPKLLSGEIELETK
ncbi:TPA: restriction endonuclease subunit S [Vibrio vulnificus]|nr:restriction endonuclease subunit S [Vibrio vulnificus]